MTIDELEDEAAADEAEKAVRKPGSLASLGAAVESGEPPVFTPEQEETQRWRNVAAESNIAAQNGPGVLNPFKAGLQGLGGAATHAFDVLETAASPVLYGAKKLLGSGPNDERALAGSIAKPIDNLVTGAKNLYGGVKELLGGEP